MTKNQINEFTLRISQANHSELTAILSEIVISYMKDAELAYANRDVVEYSRNIELSKKSITELIDCVNPINKTAIDLIAIMRFVFRKLVSSGVKKSPDELDRCIGIMENLNKAFVHLAEIDNDGPVMKNTHQVYAGLTYGKGTLNESINANDYANRGFKA